MPRPEGAPEGASFFYVRPNSKTPATSSGRLDAMPEADFEPLGGNYGIALKGIFVAVDIDKPAIPEASSLVAALSAIPDVWAQRTPKGGYHFLFREPSPGAFLSTKDGKLVSRDGTIYGDIIAHASIQGPGSSIDGKIYTRILDTSVSVPPIAPKKVMDLWAGARRGLSTPETGGVELSGIPPGAHDSTLVSVAGYLREKLSLSAEAIETVLGGFVPILEGQDASRPYSGTDIARIATSVCKYPPGVSKEDAEACGISILPSGWETGEDVAEVNEQEEDMLPGYLPAIGLSIMYGDGKVGKSSLAAWIAAYTVSRGKKVVFIESGEESWDKFVRKAKLSAAIDFPNTFHPRNILRYPSSSTFVLPGSASSLKHDLELLGPDVGLVYIDAIMSHMDHSLDLNAAEKARTCLKSVGDIALELKLSILGTTHENKTGALLGSTEVRNVPRGTVQIVRPKDGHLRVKAAGANGYQVSYQYEFTGHCVECLDPQGQPLVKTDMDGNDIPQTFYYVVKGGRVGKDTASRDMTTEINVDEIAEPRVPNRTKVKQFLRDNPEFDSFKRGASARISEETGVHVTQVLRILAEMNNQPKGGE